MATQEIQELRRDIPFIANGDGPHVTEGGMGFMVLNWIGAQGDFAPAYWSTERDKWLRDFYLRSDYLKIAVRTFVQKAYAIPLTIAARDRSVKAHNALAEQLHYNITRNSGLLRGFTNEFQKFIVDYLTQDNGAFMLVMGGGKADGPINGPVSGLLHLDAQRCTRTGHPEYPVVYYHTDGKRYALHYTRVIFMSSTPSADAAHNDIGVCAVSACIDAAHDMCDIMTYTSEKLGSRPARQILYAKTGATLAQMRDATQLANVKMDAQSLERFSRTMLMAPAQQSGTPLELATVDLSSAPDGFDREKATVMDVAVIAAAFGMDARDLAHSFGLAGQTKADAEVQNLKTYGKGVSQFLTDFAEQLDQKVLPDALESWFDYVDDTQDQQAAAIRKTRAEGREIDLRTEAVTVRVAREQMLENDEISEEQFEDMELAEGRLADGLDVLMLFQSRDGEIARLLDLGVDNPLDVEANDATAILAAIDEHVRMAWERTTTAPNANIVRKAKQALAALAKLRGLYDVVVNPPVEPVDEGAPPEDEEPEDEAPPDETKALITKQEADLDELMADYEAQFDEVVQAAIDGEIDEETFNEELSAIVAALLLAAFLRGAQMDEAQLTIRLRAIISDEVDVNLEAISGFADDIYAGRYAEDDLGVDSAKSRIGVWVGAMAGLYAIGQLQRAGDPFYEWVYGPTDHCADCQRLNGQVHTASEWARSGWTPRSRGLACRGYRCQCAFVEVSGPSRGGF